jgi:hypothetical protein
MISACKITSWQSSDNSPEKQTNLVHKVCLRLLRSAYSVSKRGALLFLISIYQIVHLLTFSKNRYSQKGGTLSGN